MIILRPLAVVAFVALASSATAQQPGKLPVVAPPFEVKRPEKVSADLQLLHDLVDQLIAAHQRIISLEAQAASAQLVPLRADVERRIRASLQCTDAEDLEWAALKCVPKPKPAATDKPTPEKE
jgi:hypothetical protein